VGLRVLAAAAGRALYVQVLHGMETDAPSYLVCVDAATGKNRWKVERKTPAIQESPDAYTTPTFVRAGGKVEIVVTGGDVVTAHDPASGQGAVALVRHEPDERPVVPRGRVARRGGRPRGRTVARAADAGAPRGRPRRRHRQPPRVVVRPGPRHPDADDRREVRLRGRRQGDRVVPRARDGKVVYGPQRIANGTYSASPVLADGKLYVVNEDGLTTVLKAGPAFEVLSENALSDTTLATPAVAGGQIFIRTAKKLYCLGSGPSPSAGGSGRRRRPARGTPPRPRAGSERPASRARACASRRRSSSPAR
jgi:hypothetical protein